VVVTSGDEFEDLAASFNLMARRLGSQFRVLSTIGEVTQVVLSSLETRRIVETVLGRMKDVCPCDRVGIIREGRLLAVESIAALKERALRKLEIDFGGTVPAEAFANLPGVRDVTVDDGVLRCTVMGSLDALVKAAAKYEVRNLRSLETSLEEIFMAYYGAGESVPDREAGHAAA